MDHESRTICTNGQLPSFTSVVSIARCTMTFHVIIVALLTNVFLLEMSLVHGCASYLEGGDVSPEKNPLHRVFVYGTLKRGEPNHKIIQDKANGFAKFLGLGRTTVPYPLIIATNYNIPFLLKKSGTGHHVFGEVYDVDSKMFERLDELEEHPSFYERTQEDVLMAQESKLKRGNVTFEQVGTLVKAWIYFLPKFKLSLLEKPMYSSYSNEGDHGLKYGENDENAARPEDVLC